MKIKVSKNYKGLVSVRNYICQKAIGKREKLEIEHDGQTMTIPYEDIEASIISKSAPMPSKFDVGKTYQLVDFLWMPDKNAPKKTEEEKQ